MSHARRRSAQLLFALLTAILLTFAVTTTTAFAADESEESHGEEELSGFGAGQWDGMLLAAGAGLLFAVVTFSMSSPGDIHRVEDHH